MIDPSNQVGRQASLEAQYDFIVVGGPGTNASAHMIAGRAAELILGRNT